MLQFNAHATFMPLSFYVVMSRHVRLQINGSGAPPERNWRGVLQPCFVLRKAREDVEKYSDARGALKQAMCSMSVSIDQVPNAFRLLFLLLLLRVGTVCCAALGCAVDHVVLQA